MRHRRRTALAAALALTLLTTACTRQAVTQPEFGAERGESAAVVASAGVAALADLRVGNEGPVNRANAGLDAQAFAQADTDRDGTLSATEQTAAFWQVWKAMTAVTTTAASKADKDEDGAPFQNTGSYSVPHSLKFTPTQAELFIDAAEILPAVYQTLQAAKTSIHLDLFLLGGAEGRKLAEVLVAKAKEGVDVRLIHDPGYGLSGVARQQILPVIAYLQSQGVAIKSYPLKYLQRRKGHPFANKFQIDHNKFIVVDGTTALIGTMNLIDVGVMNHDVFVRFTGEAAAELQAIHNATWQMRGPKVPDFRRVEAPKRQVAQAAESMARIIKTDIDQQTTKKVLLENIKAAKKSVKFAIFEFGDMDVVTELIAAYKRGVDVRVLADKNANYAKYLDAFKGVNLYGTPNLATMNRLREAGVPVKWYVPKTDDQELHMKVAIFDGDRAIVGSTNFTYQAFKTFRETSIEIVGPTVGPRLESMWQRDWETSATPVLAPTFFEKCVISAVKAMDKLNLSWW